MRLFVLMHEPSIGGRARVRSGRARPGWAQRGEQPRHAGWRGGEDGALAIALPKFVKKELESYLDCGLLCRGFARVQCTSCSDKHLVAFGCGGRGFCPSCLGRKVAETALNLQECVLPPDPLRQWVLTFPFAWRSRLGFDAPLFGALTRLFVQTVLGFYTQRVKNAGGATIRNLTRPILMTTPMTQSIALALLFGFITACRSSPAPRPAPVVASVNETAVATRFVLGDAAAREGRADGGSHVLVLSYVQRERGRLTFERSFGPEDMQVPRAAGTPVVSGRIGYRIESQDLDGVRGSVTFDLVVDGERIRGTVPLVSLMAGD